MALLDVAAVDLAGRRAFGAVCRTNAPATQLVSIDPEREVLQLDTPLALIYGFALSPAGRRFAAFGRELAAGYQDGRVVVWDLGD